MITKNQPLDVKPIAGTIGAEIYGVDLTQPLNKDLFNAINEIFLEYLVIFFPEQKPLSKDQLKIFAKNFGELDTDPFVYPFKIPFSDGYPEVYENIKKADNKGINIGGYWHTDVTYRSKPHAASVNYAKDVPEYGGDTMFANQYLAYDTLPSSLKDKIETMEAVHSSAMPHGQTAARFASIDRSHAPTEDDRLYEKTGQEVADVEVIENIHPVVRVHPQTGRKLLYLNRGFTSHFVGMTPKESLPLLEQLWTHASRAEFTCRYRWSQHTVGVWDNCATQHYAINDYYGKRRHMQRISIHEV